MPAIQIAHSQRSLSDTKHIDVKMHFIQDYCFKRYIEIKHIRTQEQLADSLTKPMNNVTHIQRILLDQLVSQLGSRGGVKKRLPQGDYSDSNDLRKCNVTDESAMSFRWKWSPFPSLYKHSRWWGRLPVALYVCLCTVVFVTCANCTLSTL
jgi:hypothetical protein